MLRPPRRLDVEEQGSFFATHPIAIFVDGERQARVLAYDLDEGFVRKIATDGDGRILVEQGEVVEAIVRGHVQVSWRKARARA
jgi:hypothetical protein